MPSISCFKPFNRNGFYCGNASAEVTQPSPVYCRQCVAVVPLTARSLRTDQHVGPLLLLLLLHLPDQTPEPEPARGLRQTRDQGEGAAHRGGSGGPLLCSGKLHGTGTDPVSGSEL